MFAEIISHSICHSEGTVQNDVFAQYLPFFKPFAHVQNLGKLYTFIPRKLLILSSMCIYATNICK